MNRSATRAFIKAGMKSRSSRIVFVALAIAAAVAAIMPMRQQVSDGLERVTVADLGATFCLSLLYLLCSSASWRAVLCGFGSSMTARSTTRIFFLSQIGKYLPGGVFSFAAAAEMGHDAGLSRRYTVSTLLITLVLTIATGMSLALMLLPLAVGTTYCWIGLVLLATVAVLHPAVLRRLLALVWIRIEQDLTGLGIATASAWATAGWVMIGMQVWLLAGAVGSPLTFSTLFLATGGFALAWVTGFLVLVAPAGFGAREATLTLVLANLVTPAEALVVALLSRVVITAAEFVAAAVTLVLIPRR